MPCSYDVNGALGLSAIFWERLVVFNACVVWVGPAGLHSRSAVTVVGEDDKV